MKRAALILAAAVAALGLMAGCDPSGQPCHRAGDVKVDNGHAHTCVQKRDGLVWS
jgi:hypothetical protein